MGIESRHTPGFRIDRPLDPYGTNLVLCFRSPAVILTANGIETANPGDCIVHSSTFPQYHCSVADATEGYHNDWLHVRPSVLVPIMERIGLPLDRLIPSGQPGVLAPAILRLQAESATPDDFSDAMIQNQLEALVLAMARAHREARSLRDTLTASERRHLPECTALRQEIRENCAERIAVRDLAARVHLSPERFAAVYQALFGTTPYAEVMEARLVMAKRLLSSTDLAVKEIAFACGWGDHQYFSRLFKRKTGLPPSRYRESVLPRRCFATR
jgi:AraC-like DNA-binding protein